MRSWVLAMVACGVVAMTPAAAQQFLGVGDLAVARDALAAHPDLPGIGAGGVLKLGTEGPEVAVLREALRVRGLATTAENPSLYDAGLEEAVRRYQQFSGLDTTGMVGDQTRRALNAPPMELVRRLDQGINKGPLAVEDRHVLVSIAAREVRLVEHGAVTLTSRAIVGKRATQTPEIESRITRVVFNPPWTVPPGIMRRDMVPKLKRDPAVMDKLGLRVYDQDGRELAPEEVAAHPSPMGLRVVQRPGAGNALGRFKLEFANNQAIYLHDTSEPHKYADTARLLSSGCVRVEQVALLAKMLVGEAAWVGQKVEERLAKGETFSVKLETPVAVSLYYRLAEPMPEGGLRILPDVYGRGGI